MKPPNGILRCRCLGPSSLVCRLPLPTARTCLPAVPPLHHTPATFSLARHPCSKSAAAGMQFGARYRMTPSLYSQMVWPCLKIHRTTLRSSQTDSTLCTVLEILHRERGRSNLTSTDSRRQVRACPWHRHIHRLRFFFKRYVYTTNERLLAPLQESSQSRTRVEQNRIEHVS